MLNGRQRADEVLHGRSVIGQEVGHCACRVADTRCRVSQRVGTIGQPGNQLFELVDGVVEIVLVANGGVQHDVEVLNDLTDRLVPVRQPRSQLRGLPENVVDGAAFTLEHLDDRGRDGVDLLRFHGPEKRFEAAYQRIEVQRRLSTRQRDESSWWQHPVRAITVGALQLHVPVSDQVRISDLSCRRLIHRQRAVDADVRPHPLPPSSSRRLLTLPTSTPEARTN